MWPYGPRHSQLNLINDLGNFRGHLIYCGTQGRISGPLLDRIDVQVEVPAVAPEALSAAPDGEASALIAQRVAAARARAIDRQGGVNALLSGEALDAHCALDDTSAKFLQTAAARLGWSARGFHRVLRVARSIADLAASERIATAHLAEAIQYRRVLHRP